MIDLLTAFEPTRIFLGSDIELDEPFTLSPSDVEKGWQLVMAVRSGKTDELTEFLRQHGFGPRGWIYFDFAGTGFSNMAKWDALVSMLLYFGVEQPFADDLPEARDVSARYIARHAYADVGEVDPPIRMNILRRMRLRDGRVETPQQVAGRFADVWSTQYADDNEKRVLFAKWGQVVAGLLSAADRVIPEYHRVFEDEQFRAYLRRAHEANGTLADPFVRDQWDILKAQFLDLKAESNKGDKVTVRQFQEVMSFHNSLAPLRTGPMATFFSGPHNFDLEGVAYGGKRLYLSTTKLANINHRKFVHRAVWSQFDALVNHIKQDDPVAIGYEIHDEVGALTEAHFTAWAQRGNHRWAPILLRQSHEAQFEMMGLKSAAGVINQCFRLATYGRPETEALARMIAIRGPIPDYQEMILTLISHSSGRSESEAASEAQNWMDSFGASEGTGGNESDHPGGASRGRSWQQGTSTQRGKGGSSSTSTQHGTSESESEVHMRVPIDEILLHRTLEIGHLPPFTAVYAWDNNVRTVRHHRARQMPDTLFGIDLLSRYLGRNRRMHDASARQLPPVDTSISIVSPAPTAQPNVANAPYRH